MLAACTAVGIHIVGGFNRGFFFPPVYGFLKLGCEQPQGILASWQCWNLLMRGFISCGWLYWCICDDFVGGFLMASWISKSPGRRTLFWSMVFLLLDASGCVRAMNSTFLELSSCLSTEAQATYQCQSQDICTSVAFSLHIQLTLCQGMHKLG